MPSSANRIYIGLGSNLGDCRANLDQAFTLLSERLGLSHARSSYYRSEPVGVKEQPWFLNQIAYFEAASTIPGPTILLEKMQAIERELGREPAPRFGPRLIDLDLLFYKDWVIETNYLAVPHPRLTERAFVLMPLVELALELVHPILGKSISDILDSKRSQLAYCECVKFANGH